MLGCPLDSLTQPIACLLITEGAEGLTILVLTALVAQFEVEREHELLVRVHVDLILDVFVAEERLCVTLSTLETLRAFPVALGHLDQLGLQAPEMVYFVTDRAYQEAFPLFA